MCGVNVVFNDIGRVHILWSGVTNYRSVGLGPRGGLNDINRGRRHIIDVDVIRFIDWVSVGLGGGVNNIIGGRVHTNRVCDVGVTATTVVTDGVVGPGWGVDSPSDTCRGVDGVVTGGGRGCTFGDGCFWTDGVRPQVMVRSGVDGVSGGGVLSGGGRGVDGVSVISITWSININDRLLTGNSSNLSKFRILFFISLAVGLCFGTGSIISSSSDEKLHSHEHRLFNLGDISVIVTPIA